jgi:hypothetical protein
MRTSDSLRIDTGRVLAAGFCGLALILAAAGLAFVFDEVRWLALVAVGGGILAGAAYIGYRQRRGPLDWDQHYADKTESNFHHL